jgi:hypothetical protein
MATGFEAAGLALAIFPLVVQCIGFYIDGARKIKDIKDYEIVLKRLARDLRVECGCFEAACDQLLEGLASPGQVTLLMKGMGWDDVDLKECLRECLGPDRADTFTELVEELLMSIEKLKKDLGIKDNRVCDDITQLSS